MKERTRTGVRVRSSEICGSNSGVESQPSKLLVAGSIPVSRSNGFEGRRGDHAEGLAHVAQSVEHVLGKDEVTSSILVVGSIEGIR
jgi:hypothetical protein